MHKDHRAAAPWRANGHARLVNLFVFHVPDRRIGRFRNGSGGCMHEEAQATATRSNNGLPRRGNSYPDVKHFLFVW